MDNNEHGMNLASLGTDCISRQAAIDAMAELQGSTSSKGVLKGISKAWKRIEQLPPIQPVNNSEMPNSSDVISRQAAIDAIQAHKHNVLDAREYDEGVACGYAAAHNHICDVIAILPPAQPDIIRCKDCKYASGNSRICLKLGHSPIGELDFCSYAEKREVTT